jgi:type II secretion system protein G
VKRSRLKPAFTLIELLVVIIILGILAALITGNFFTSLKKGRDAKRKADLEQVQRALELHYEDNRAYPEAIYVSGGEISDTETGKVYMKKVPVDPQGSTYGYETDEDGTYYKLYACLENDQQILPYESTPVDFDCEHNCKNQLEEEVACIWGISSPNTEP